MKKQQSMQKHWSWIMGGMTLLVSLFFPPLGGPFSGTFWAFLFSYYPSVTPFVGQLTRVLCMFFPTCILVISTIWLWSRQMHWHPTILRALLVALEALGIAFVATIIFSVVVFVLIDNGGWYAATLFPMEHGGWYAAILLSLMSGLAFLVFCPCLLIVAMVLASFQRKTRPSDIAASTAMSDQVQVLP